MKILYCFLFLSVFHFSKAQTTILSEDFNNGFPLGWQLIDHDMGAPYNNSSVNFITDAFVMAEDYDSTGTGDSILVATSWLDPIVDANDFLILPSVTLGPSGNYIYFETKSIDQSYPDGIQLLYTFNDFSVDTIMSSGVLFDTIAAPPYWTQFAVDLDTLGLENQTVHLVFRHYGNDQFILALDNIRIDINDPSNVQNTLYNDFSIYPNPSNGLINVQGLRNATTYKIFNLHGQLLENGTVIDIIQTSLEKGIYLLQINSETIKLIIK